MARQGWRGTVTPGVLQGTLLRDPSASAVPGTRTEVVSAGDYKIISVCANEQSYR